MSVIGEINWQLIVIIAITSAAVSYLGDIIGKKIGKSKASIFGMRPRHAATIMAVLTGIAVAAITVIAASAASSSIRHAFFGVNYLDRQITQLNVDVRDRQFQLEEMELEMRTARDELERLRQEARALEKGLGDMKGKRIIAFGGEVLSQTVVSGDVAADDVDHILNRLIHAAHKRLAEPNDPTARSAVSADIVIQSAEAERIKAKLADTTGRRVLRMSAPSNVVMGQTLEAVVDVIDSVLVYKKDEFLLSAAVNGSLDNEEAVDLLYTSLRKLNSIASSAGIMADPHTGSVGSVGAEEFYAIAEKIASGSGARRIEIYAEQDIYSEGPVLVRVEIVPAGE